MAFLCSLYSLEEGRSVSPSLAASLQSPWGQVLGAETVLALEDGTMWVCCWWVFEAVSLVPHGCGARVETLICHSH